MKGLDITASYGCQSLTPYKFHNHSLIVKNILICLQEQKRLQEQLAAEQEALFGSRPTPKKPLGQNTSINTMAGTPLGRRVSTPSGRPGISTGKERRESVRNIIPVNYVALPKDDSSVSRGS